MPQRPLWKDFLSGAVRTGGKMIPGVSHALDTVEYVENRREAETRHDHTLAEMSRVEKSITETIEREMKAVLAKLHLPNITPRELEEEIANLYAMRGYGREPFLAQGLLTNSQWYDQLRTKPNLYGRVLNDHDTPSPDCFYMFIDSEKTRMLEVSPFALQQLLGGQTQGAPASKMVGHQDLFAERLSTPTIIKPAPIVAAESPRRVLVPGGTSSNHSEDDGPTMTTYPDGTTRRWTPHPDLRALHAKAEGGDKDAMCHLAWAIDPSNKESRHKNAAESLRWYRKAADAGGAAGMGSLGWAYVKGLGGLAVDRVKGVELLRKAFAGGNVWSGDRLKELGETP